MRTLLAFCHFEEEEGSGRIKLKLISTQIYFTNGRLVSSRSCPMSDFDISSAYASGSSASKL
jgi:hypothetical protein